MKRGGLQLIFGLILILSMFFVVAQEDSSDNQDLKLCSEQCSVDYELEENVSECMEKCNTEFGYEDIDSDFDVLPIDFEEMLQEFRTRL